MRKIAVFSVIVTIFTIFTSNSQNRNLRIGYIDMEYILQNVPDYIEARNQIEQKGQKWKQQIEEKKLEIIDLKKSLETEKILLTKELIEEREEEIASIEKELLEYQEKRFGPAGDLIMQKTMLVKPIQDQIFTVVQDIAEAKKYDFIFDKSSDLTILFALKKYDISNQIIRAIVSSSRRDQLSKKDLKELYEQEEREEKLQENPAMAERQKILDERKAERDKKIAEKKEEQEKKKKELEEAREKLIAEKTANKNKKTAQETTEERKQKQEERRQKILEAREAAKQQKLQENEEKSNQ